HAPPAFDAATTAAMKERWTLPRKTWCAIAPPINAPAMLSRKLDSIQIRASKRNPPFQLCGKNFGSTAGNWLVSKRSASKAKPVSRPSRFVKVTHSCANDLTKAPKPGPVEKPVKKNL